MLITTDAPTWGYNLSSVVLCGVCKHHLKAGRYIVNEKEDASGVYTISKSTDPVTVYFVVMTFNFPGTCVNRLAYALGRNLRSLGSCTKYS
jgi:hypothetical protein